MSGYTVKPPTGDTNEQTQFIDYFNLFYSKRGQEQISISQQLGNYGTTFFSAGFAPIFPDICYHLTHYKPAAADIPVASDNPAHYADAIRYNARTPLQGSLLPLTRLVWA